MPQRRSHAARTPYILVVVGLLIVGLLGLLALNTLLAEGSFRVHSLQTEGNSLSQQEQALREQVSSMQSPSNLQAQALAQGMVPGGPPLFLRLEDGAVLGQPSPAKAPPAPAQAPVIPQPAAAGTGR